MTAGDWAAIASAAATIVVAVFAGVQVWRERRRLKAQQRAAAIRIGAAAYLLRDRIRRWRGDESASAEQLAKWADYTRRAQTFEAEMTGALADFQQMFDVVVDSGEPIATGVRNAFVSFVLARRRLAELMGMTEPNEKEIFDWLDVRDAADADLRACLVALEETLVEPSALSEEAELRRTRQKELSENRRRKFKALGLDDDPDGDEVPLPGAGVPRG